MECNGCSGLMADGYILISTWMETMACTSCNVIMIVGIDLYLVTDNGVQWLLWSHGGWVDIDIYLVGDNDLH